MTILKRYLHEPVNTITHFIGAVASLVGLIVLLILTFEEVPKMLTLLIYSLSMVALFTASTLFHGIKGKPRHRFWLNRLDHMAIFLLIAGTYTPVAYNLFTGWWRWGTLGTVWSVAALGMGYKLLSRRIHGFFNVSIYLLLSWGIGLPIVLFTNIIHIVPYWGLFLIALGGLIYSLGFIIYYLERPDPWPKIFGHHEIWHLFVMGGSLCHFLFMLLVVVPFEHTFS
jgi:hemolysin III